MMPEFDCTVCAKASGCVFAREGFSCKSIEVMPVEDACRV